MRDGEVEVDAVELAGDLAARRSCAAPRNEGQALEIDEADRDGTDARVRRTALRPDADRADENVRSRGSARPLEHVERLTHELHPADERRNGTAEVVATQEVRRRRGQEEAGELRRGRAGPGQGIDVDHHRQVREVGGP